MVNIEKTLTQNYPALQSYPQVLQKQLVQFLRKMIHEDEINAFLTQYAHLGPFEFIEAVLEYFDFDYRFSNADLNHIPAVGRVVIVANHPLGALDGLALIHLIRKVRPDINVVANSILTQVPQLEPIILAVDNMGHSTTKEAISNIYKALDRDEAVIIFPSGEVSRVGATGVKDGKWNKGFLNFAKRSNAPILPVHIKAKNSKTFYTLSLLNKNISTALLPHEMFKQREKAISFTIGEPIPSKALHNGLDAKAQVKRLKKHLFGLKKGKRPLYKTEIPIAPPEDRRALKAELKHAQALGLTNDMKIIYLVDHQPNSAVINEIGRLREIAFRKVEEGSGKRRDNDIYDTYYRHIVLWDEDALEIVGSYRVGEANAIYNEHGKKGFYSNSLFSFNDDFTPYLDNAIELGRSFVQPRYWGTRALDYLWQGIGAYLHQHPNVRYMFGPVSLSAAYPKVAKDMLTHFYSTYFPSNEGLVTPTDPFYVNHMEITAFKESLQGLSYKDGFKLLKRELAHMGLVVPTLYKQYSDLCEEDGVQFAGFNVDQDFSDCVDGFIVVDLEKVKLSKKERYIDVHDDEAL
jgi:putative hemolysin